MALVTTIGLNNVRVVSSVDDDDFGSGDEEDGLSISAAELTTLTLGQRVILGIIVTVLCMCSILGNVGTLCASKTRKLRVFFRTCLISLAISDLITSLFTSLAYLAQFAAPAVQIWLIGGTLCRLIPFLTTGAILVSSMTLLGIAFDRYYSVMRATSGFWKPNRRSSIVLTTLIWTLSFIMAFHLLFAYTIYHVYILPEVDDSTEMTQAYLAAMCVSNKEANAYYYLVVLAIIFFPTLVAFVWLNSIIANKLWIRRHSFKVPPSSLPAVPTAAMPAGCNEPKEKQMEMIPQQYHHHHHNHHPSQQHPCHHCRGDNKICCISSTPTIPTSLAPSTGTAETKSPRSNPQPAVDGEEVRTPAVAGLGNTSAKHISSREARHLRMFTIILILMAVFIFFRLPAWLFLILRMYGSYTHRHDWILHFSFGILTLTSCVLNPLLYTFLAETIRYAMFMKGKLCGLRRYFESHCGLGACHCCYCCWLGARGDDDSLKMTQNQHQNANQNDNDNDGDGDDGEDGDNTNVNANINGSDDNYCTSNDGAKSTSKKSDDDSKVYTIIPVPERLQGCRRTGGGKVAKAVTVVTGMKRGMMEEEGWCQC